MILQSTRFSEGPIRRPTSAAQFIDTHSSWPVATSVLSRSKRENPGNEVACQAPFLIESGLFKQLILRGLDWYALRTLFEVNFREYLSINLLLVCKDKLKSNWSSEFKDWRSLPDRSRSTNCLCALVRTYSKAWKQDMTGKLKIIKAIELRKNPV